MLTRTLAILFICTTSAFATIFVKQVTLTSGQFDTCEKAGSDLSEKVNDYLAVNNVDKVIVIDRCNTVMRRGFVYEKSAKLEVVVPGI